MSGDSPAQAALARATAPRRFLVSGLGASGFRAGETAQQGARGRSAGQGSPASASAPVLLREFSSLHDAAGLAAADPRRQRCVVQMNEAQLAELRQRHGPLHIEEDQALRLLAMPGLPPRVDARALARELALRLRDAQGRPLADCTVYALAGGLSHAGLSDADGELRLAVGPAPVERLIVSPRQGCWSRVLDRPEAAAGDAGPIELSLRALQPGRDLDWVHKLLGSHACWLRSGRAGAGVRVAVVDSGIDGRHPALAPVGGLNTLDGADPAAWDVDEKGHGTHCAGVIAGSARLPSGLFSGLAPQAELYALKVFPGGYVSDLVEALDWCTAQRMDLVNLSLGSPQPSAALTAALQRAHAAGVTVLAAGGNEATHIAFPAASKPVLAVGALGRFGSFPADSGHGLKIGRYRDGSGRLFGASFSNFGEELDLVAPGVAITSTVPGGYAAWDGTSMACPLVTGLAALLLSVCPWLRSGDSRQVQAVRACLRGSALPTGLPPSVQGCGLPHAWRACQLAGA